MDAEQHIEAIIQHKIRSGSRVNLCKFNRQLREMGCSVAQRREIRQQLNTPESKDSPQRQEEETISEKVRRQTKELFN